MSEHVIMIGTMFVIRGEDDETYLQFQSGSNFRELNNKSQGILLRKCADAFLKEADETYPLQPKEGE